VNTNAVDFDHLTGADLVLDRVYRGGTVGDTRDEPLSKLLRVGNQGGFRPAGSVMQDSVKLVVLHTTGSEPDWPDALNPYTGTFTYYGDNREPGRALEDTPNKGNLLLSRVFDRLHGDAAERAKVPPFLLFDKPGGGRDVRFRGLLAPGSDRLSGEEDLVAVWRTTSGQRFQNYQARFTVLDTPVVTRAWINQLMAGQPLDDQCPAAWRAWVRRGTYAHLLAPPTVIVRPKEEQLPVPADRPLLDLVYQHFRGRGRAYDFEQFAADLWRVSEPKVDKIDVTRPWRDGGRDAIGEYLLGPDSDPVAVEFALEAKCYATTTGVSVKDTSRLISRLRHRQFGVLVTTSYVANQAYKEIREDGHPVVILAARDVIERLKARGLDTIAALRRYLCDAYPPPT
jgi:Restriction endonuclease AspBHI N-terminal/Restriction endonuclease